MEAAAELFHARGYNAVGVQEVCKAAGANKGSFYHFFDSKESLMTAIILEGRRSPCMFDVAAFDGFRSIDVMLFMYDAIAVEVGAQHERSGHVQGCPIGSLSAEVSTQSEAIREAACHALEHMSHAQTELIRRAIAEGDLRSDLEVEQVADRLLAYLQGVLLLSKTRNDPTIVARLRSGYVQLMGLDPERLTKEGSA